MPCPVSHVSWISSFLIPGQHFLCAYDWLPALELPNYSLERWNYSTGNTNQTLSSTASLLTSNIPFAWITWHREVTARHRRRFHVTARSFSKLFHGFQDSLRERLTEHKIATQKRSWDTNRLSPLPDCWSHISKSGNIFWTAINNFISLSSS